ncbi:MAG: Ribonuclease Y [Mycoplasmataceae bacterium]|nr:MAG: Ribonuclease Y [Mycoplasmataceae bacterium]
MTAEEKKQITVLDISNQNLKDKLELKDFENLQVFICSRNELTEITIDEKSLVNLTRLDCSFNQIQRINFLGKSDNLEKFIANDNLLIYLDFLTKMNSEKLIYVDMRNNFFSNYSTYDSYYGRSTNYQSQPFPLSSFSNLEKLEVLMIGNERENTKRFNGSLESLEKLTNLKRLWIRNCDITGGLEYLTEKLENFDCQDSKWIEDQLKSYKTSSSSQTYQDNSSTALVAWKKAQTYYKLYQGLRDREIKPLQEKLIKEENDLKNEKNKNSILQKQLEDEKEKLVNKNKEVEKTNNTLSAYQKFVENLLKSKRSELSKLNSQAKTKLQVNSEWLETFYRAQKEVDRNVNNTFAQEQVEKSRNILKQSLTEDEIQTSLTKQREIWQLEKELVELNIYEERYEAKVEAPPKYTK